MSRRAGIKSLEAAIKRLEAAAGKGQRHCVYCRFMLCHSRPDPKEPKPRPEDVITVKCEFCHSEYTVSLDGNPEAEREAARLSYSFTLEDQYTNPKAHALELWHENRPERKKSRENSPIARGKAKNNPNARALAKLRDEVLKLFARKHKRLEAKYGDDPFPEHTQLIESVQDRESRKRETRVYPQGLFDLELEETQHLIRAELEKIIWGETRPETATAIEKIDREIDELIRTAEEEAERRKEEAR